MSLVTVWAIPVSDTFNLTDPVDIQNAWITLLSHSFLHFGQTFFQYVQRLSFIPRLSLFILSEVFFSGRTLLASLRLENLIITFSRSTFLESIFMPISLKTFNVRFSRFPFSVVSGSPVISKHSHLMYWLLAQHWGSKHVTLSQSFRYKQFCCEPSKIRFQVCNVS